MNDQLSFDFTELLESAKKSIPLLLQEASETDAPDLFPERSLQFLRDFKFLTACIPSKYGGKNLGLKSGTNFQLLSILKIVGKGNPVVGRILEGHFNAQLLIEQYGDDEQKRKFAEDAFAGKLFGVWNTQANDGTHLVNKNGQFYLSGSKIFATGIDYVSRPIVTAQFPDDSLQMCIVPLDEVAASTDSSWWNPMGMKSTRSYKITFNNALIPTENLVGNAGNYYEQPAFSGGSIRFSAVQLGAAEMLLLETITYLQDLNRSEDPFQKMRIGEMTILMESGNQWLSSAAFYLDQFMTESTEENAGLFLHYANMCRTAIDEICTKIINLCQKCVGARGLNKPYHFERIIRDLTIYLRQPAPDHILTEVGRYALQQKKSKT